MSQKLAQGRSLVVEEPFMEMILNLDSKFSREILSLSSIPHLKLNKKELFN
jgi:hypothetical protein